MAELLPMTEPPSYSTVITNRVVQDGDTVFGVYESASTYLMIHYVNKGVSPTNDLSTSHLDVEEMFQAMEALDRRKGRK